MKVLHINNDYALSGGIGKYLINVVPELTRGGHEVVVVHGDNSAMGKIPHTPGRFQHKNGINIYSVPNCHVYSVVKRKRKVAEVMDIIQKEQPDVVHLHGVNDSFLEAEIYGIKPVVKFIHNHSYCPTERKLFNNDTSCNKPLSVNCLLRLLLGRCRGSRRPYITIYQSLRARSENKVYKKLHKITVASTYVKRCLVQNGFREEQVEVVPYFTEIPELIRDSTDENIILFVGRVVRDKGLGYLLRACAFLKRPHKVVVAGDGPDAENCKRLAKQLGIENQVEFAGWISQEDIAHYYRRAWVVVMPSIWAEPFGIVGIEAMSHSRPVVAFDVGGVSDWLEDDKTGFLVEPGNVRQLAGNIEILLENKKLAQEFGINGRKIAEERFSKDVHATRLLEIYKEVIDRWSE